MLKALLATFSAPPKTLDQARHGIDQSKAFASSVETLFANAGLNLETLLAAGPDSLKVYLAGFDGDDVALAALQTERDGLAGQLTLAQAQLTAHADLLKTIGLDTAAATTPEAVKPALEAHVAKQVTLALAKTGHPPVQHIDPTAPANKTAADADLHAAWKALPTGSEERAAFFALHQAAIWRHGIKS